MKRQTRSIQATFIGLGEYKKCMRQDSWAETSVEEVEIVNGCKIQRKSKGEDKCEDEESVSVLGTVKVWFFTSSS